MLDAHSSGRTAVLSNGAHIPVPPAERPQANTGSTATGPRIRRRGLRCTIVLCGGEDATRLEAALRAWAPVVVDFEHEVLLVNDGHLSLNVTALGSIMDNLAVLTPPRDATPEQTTRLAAERAGGKYLVFAPERVLLDRLTIRKLAGRLEVTGLAATTRDGAAIVNRNTLLEYTGLSELLERSAADGESTRRRQYHHHMFAELAHHIDLKGKRVLVLGCSYGMECELMRLAGASRVVGVDTYPWLGVYYGHHAIEYVRTSAEQLPFGDGSFDVCFSIATFEHIPDPWAAAEEALRVTASGGLLYIHAAPLWNSPHGHHKDHVLPDPWIHLAMPSAERMKAFYRDILDRPAEGATVADVIDWLYHHNDCNRRPLGDYHRILRRMLDDGEPIRVEFTMKPRGMLTLPIRGQLTDYTDDELLTESLLWILRRT